MGDSVVNERLFREELSFDARIFAAGHAIQFRILRRGAGRLLIILAACIIFICAQRAATASLKGRDEVERNVLSRRRNEIISDKLLFMLFL